MIQLVIRTRFASIRRCHEQGLRKTPGVTGKVLVSFEIGANGRVQQGAAESDLGEPLTACVLASVRALRFPIASEPTQVTYPFVFTAN